jgi:hypothetical protein
MNISASATDTTYRDESWKEKCVGKPLLRNILVATVDYTISWPQKREWCVGREWRRCRIVWCLNSVGCENGYRTTDNDERDGREQTGIVVGWETGDRTAGSDDSLTAVRPAVSPRCDLWSHRVRDLWYHRDTTCNLTAMRPVVSPRYDLWSHRDATDGPTAIRRVVSPRCDMWSHRDTTCGLTAIRPVVSLRYDLWSHRDTTCGLTAMRPVVSPRCDLWSHRDMTCGLTEIRPVVPPRCDLWSHRDTTRGPTEIRSVVPPRYDHWSHRDMTTGPTAMRRVVSPRLFITRHDINICVFKLHWRRICLKEWMDSMFKKRNIYLVTSYY